MTREDLEAAGGRLSHYARKNDIARGRETGAEVTALCGQRWIPTENPEKYPLCSTCEEIFESLVKEV